MTKTGFARALYSAAPTSALVLAFIVASSRPARTQNLAPPLAITQTLQQQDNKEAGHTYWRYPDYDGIIDVWKDTSGIHFRVHSINPENQKVREMVAGQAKKDTASLTEADFQKAVGYVAQLRDMKEGKDGKWRGKIWIEARKEHFGLDIQFPKGTETRLSIRGYIVEGWKRFVTLGNPGNIVGMTMEFSPVANPPPRGVNHPSLPARAQRDTMQKIP